MTATLIVGILVAQRLSELVLSKRNEKAVRAEGAVEFGANHYWMFFVLHTAWLFGILIEGNGNDMSRCFALLLILAILTQALRYWAIFSLGKYWNTKILVVPGKGLVSRGPYRFIAHPNYVAVCIELLVIPLMVQALTTAIVVSVLNLIVLFVVRIPEENKALRSVDI